MTDHRLQIAALGIVAFSFLASPTDAYAQDEPTVFHACYAPRTGVVYRIKGPDLPDECQSTRHVEFSWIDGLPGHLHANLNGLEADDHPHYLLADGTRPLAGDLSAGGHKVTGLAAATADGEAVRFQQAVKAGDDAGGDLSAAYPAPSVVGLRGNPLSEVAPGTGEVLTWDGSAWAPGPAASASSDHGALDGLADDDHSQYLLVDGVRHSAQGFAVSATAASSRVPVEGAGIRLMWHGSQGALRAGGVSGSEWNETAIGAYSVAFGFGTTASGNGAAAFGREATASGHRSIAGGQASIASGDGATAFGREAMATAPAATAFGNKTSASGNGSTAAGWNSVASGGGATALGLGATASGHSATAAGNNTTASGLWSTALGHETTASGVQSTALGNMASTNGKRGAFVYGDAGASTTVEASADNQFVVRASGGTTFYSFPDLSTGVELAPGGGAWSTLSDRDRKDHFRVVDSEEVLNTVVRLPVQTWSYKAQDRSIRHLGPTAQDFHAAFGLGGSDTMITTTDISGVNMVAIQALATRTAALVAANETLKAENGALHAMLDEVRARLERLERRCDERTEGPCPDPRLEPRLDP